jgi:hypothetical protein
MNHIKVAQELVKVAKLLVAVNLSDAIRRRNVEPDGTIYHWGEKVAPTHEVVMAIEKKVRLSIDVEKRRLNRLKELSSLIKSPAELYDKARRERLDGGWLIEPDSPFSSGSSFNVKLALQDSEDIIRKKEQYLDDIRDAERAYRSSLGQG